ncbi:MAG TPA: cation:proton antiporter [Blastocatellia bacterium]|nr:cation:proton antiporter [Blastocatellia bacterium]HMV85362.1 cation:proton antiporter [Blastocatellia bacterium]HMX28023.1 cation:proton antiporter [Blastocatellia bacterium]HMY73919.1 cation:proton antiporter [Blastocatellia bacterium]HMZ18384.1 cation:proton antiporter [Blastocatellia bacterium]
MTETPLFMFALASDSHTQFFFTLLVMFVAAKLAAELFERLKQPAVAGEILAGVVIGPSVLGLIAPSELTDALAELGVIFLLFLVGLETKPADIFRVGGRALLVAVLGVVLPFIAGYLLLWAWGKPQIEAIFVGAAMVATSVGITARVLGQMGLINSVTARIILGAAVIDDILGLIILAVVSSLAKGGVNYAQIATTAGLAIGFTLIVALLGARAINKIQPKIQKLKVGQSYLVFGFSLCLVLAYVASFIGVAAIIGAFLAGMALSESTEDTDMPIQAEAVAEFLLPFFLTSIGMKLKLEALLSREAIWLAVLITLLAVVTKLIGCGLGALSLGFKDATRVGMGMVPRGEVGIVVAQIGLSLAAVTDAVYGVVLVMAVATTLIAPPFLVVLYRGETGEKVDRAYPLSNIS